MHPQVTTIYLVGQGQALTIDSGEDMERYRWMLKGYLAASEHADIAISAITHHHSDHCANLRWLNHEFGAEVRVIEPAVPLLDDRLPDTGVHLMADGDRIDVQGGVSLRVIYTPGHSVDSACYYLEDEGVLFTGDTVLGSSTTTVNDLADFMSSLERLLTLPNLQLMCPGHGPVIHEPQRYIADYIAHRNAREQQILDTLAGDRVLTSWEIMEALYTNIDSRLRRAADGNVRSHLRKLEKEGRIQMFEGRRRERSPEELAKVADEEHERVEVIRKADEYREQARRRALFMQENPPADEWEEPPHFALT
jgi:glyoxylase-like metal-dependent hydrolase (beta-lactamase superfamily II)